jgi:hypothetical protein
MEGVNDWRPGLRRFLAERIGQELSVGDLFDRFGAGMPLHHATRLWTVRGRELGTTPHELMRWEAFLATLRQLRVRFEPPISGHAPTGKTTRVIAETIVCSGCGRAFFSYVQTRTCSQTCGASLRWRKAALVKTEAEPLTNLTDLAARIRAEHKVVGEGLQHAIAAGQLLVEAKSKTPCGEWQAWLEVNCEMSERTARAYMRVARSRRNLGLVNRQRVADSSLRGALKLLCKTTRPREADVTPNVATEQTIVHLRSTDPRVHRYTINFTENEFQLAKHHAERRGLKISDVVREATRVLFGGEVRQAAE